MSLSKVERVLLAVTSLAVLYRFIRDEWPVGLEIERTEADD